MAVRVRRWEKVWRIMAVRVREVGEKVWCIMMCKRVRWSMRRMHLRNGLVLKLVKEGIPL